ncbi:MAG TPA: hypothetical protein VJ777_06445 [Mycobacterium sp.]|nr:hypothetical protein [Mycobacterium sp.]
MSATQPTPTTDAVGDLVWRALTALVAVGALLVALPLVVPTLAAALAGETVATRTRFWVTYRWHWLINTIAIAIVAALLAVEAVFVVQWAQPRVAAGADLPTSLADLASVSIPWLVLNVLAGVLLLPVAWSVHRRRIADRVRARRIADVIRQTRIESARKRAADTTAARRIGVRLHPTTGKIDTTRRSMLTAPHEAPDGRNAFAFVSRTTITTVADRFRDHRQVRDWITPDGALVVLPDTAAAVRAMVIAESGSGKTVLIDSVVLCALDYGWPVFVIDAKGDPADAAHLAELADRIGVTAQVGGGWDLFNGTPDQVTAKLMRLMPPPDGANQHYLDEIRGVLQAVQHDTAIRSVDELKERLTRPAQFVRDQFDLQMVNASVDRNGTTAGARALQSLLVALRPLERFIATTGWSYTRPAADLTVVPLSPVDEAQARIGDLLLLDLRGYLAARLTAGDKTPVLVVVDEFPQLVTALSDPGDTAGALFETARSAGVGLILATQSPAGLSNDEIRRRRALTSGAALIFGRTKDPEEIVKYAGTVMQMESAGAASGDELRSARAQHTFVIPPQDVREAADGAFWLIQGGAIAPFRALPLRPPTKVQNAIVSEALPQDEEEAENHQEETRERAAS